MCSQQFAVSRRWVGRMAWLSSSIVAVQIVLLVLGRDGICLSQGCQVVDELTRVPPLVFNLAGLFFFQAVAWGVFRTDTEKAIRWRIVQWLLLAGLAAEGVLVGFQLFVVGVFCTYCLIILGCIVLLNLLAGKKQLLAGTFVFASVFLAFSSLQFKQDSGLHNATRDGVFASRIHPSSPVTVHLFFSSTCTHCHSVLEAMARTPALSMLLNPIDRISSLDIPGLTLNGQYSPEANRALLNALDIQEIPVLLEHKNTGLVIIKGENAILRYLDTFASSGPEATATPVTPINSAWQIDSFSGAGETTDGCSVQTDCESTE